MKNQQVNQADDGLAALAVGQAITIDKKGILMSKA